MIFNFVFELMIFFFYIMKIIFLQFKFIMYVVCYVLFDMLNEYGIKELYVSNKILFSKFK